MPFPELLHRLREKAGLSQSELAAKAGVPVRSVQNWEQGHRRPRAEVLLSIAKALGVPVESLLVEMAGGEAPEPAASPAEQVEEMPPKKPARRKPRKPRGG